ncbi:hypothetical protein ACA910_015698 [Epithemia clementina (nom. ined.)]
MLEALYSLWGLWDWIVSGFCDPQSGIQNNNNNSTTSDTIDDNHASRDRTVSSDDSSSLFLTLSTEEAVDLEPCHPTASIQDIWQEQEATQSRQLKLLKWDIQQSTLQYLLEQTQQLALADRLQEIMLFWCSFHLTDGTEEDMIDFVEENGATLEIFRFWKPRHSNAVPNEILRHLLQKSIPQQKLPALQTLELSYFDLRQHSIGQALSNALVSSLSSTSNASSYGYFLTKIDISYCKTNLGFFQRFFDALRRSSQNNRYGNSLKTLSFRGNGIDDAILKVIVQDGFLSTNVSTTRNLRKLHLSHNRLTSASLPTLSLLLTQAQPLLEVLHLRGNESFFEMTANNSTTLTQQLQGFSSASCFEYVFAYTEFGQVWIDQRFESRRHVASGFGASPVLHDEFQQ